MNEQIVYDFKINEKPALKALADINTKLNNITNSFENVKSTLTSGWLKLGATITATALAVKNFTDAYESQLQAEVKLQTALKATAGIGKMNLDQWKSFASELQNVTTIGDETTLSFVAFLKTLKLTDDQIKKVIVTAIDLSTATGMTLEEAVRNLARTYNGLAGELGETIPALKELTAEELQAGKAVDLVAEAVRGQARAWADTALGSLEQASNAFGDVKEQAGAFFATLIENSGIVPKITNWFSQLSASLGDLILQFKQVSKVSSIGELKKIVEQENQEIEKIQNKTKGMSGLMMSAFGYTAELQKHINRRNEALAKIRKLEKEHTAATVKTVKTKIRKINDFEIKAAEKLKKLKMDVFEYQRYLAKKELEQNLKNGVDKKLAYELYNAEIKKIAKDEADYRASLAKKTKTKIVKEFKQENTEKEAILKEFNDAYLRSVLDVYSYEEYKLAEQYLKYQKYVKDKNKLDQWMIVEVEKIEKQRQEAINQMREHQIQQAKEQWEQLHELDLKIRDSFVHTFGDQLKQALETGKLNFKDFVNAIIADMAKVYVESKLMDISKLIGFGFFALGGVSTKPERYALGGVVTRPTQINNALVGERNRPEAILPLRRTSDGELGVKATGLSKPIINIINKTDTPIKADDITTTTTNGEHVINVVIEGIYKDTNGITSLIKGIR